MRRAISWLAAAGAWCLAFVVGFRQLSRATAEPWAGGDLTPLRDAGIAITRGQDVYADPLFVYPPTAAPLFIPLGWLPERTALTAWDALCLAAIGVTALVVARASGSRRWVLLAGVGAGLAWKSDLTTDSLLLANLSIALGPAAVLVALAAERRRDHPAAWLLAGTMLVKPLLAPLWVILAVRRAWQPIAAAGAAAGALLTVAVLLVPGGTRFLDVLRYLGGGSNLTGDLAHQNLSLAGLAESLGVPAIAGVGRPTAAVLCALVVWVLARRRAPGDLAAAGAAAFLGVLLVGSLAEVHFLYVPAGLAALAAALRGRPRDWLALVPALLTLFVPRFYLGGGAADGLAFQARWVAAEVLILAATAWMAGAAPREDAYALTSSGAAAASHMAATSAR